MAQEPNSDVLFLGFAKGDEQYILIWRPYYQKDLFKTLGRWAANKELSLTWQDAVKIHSKIYQSSRSRI